MLGISISNSLAGKLILVLQRPNIIRGIIQFIYFFRANGTTASCKIVVVAGFFSCVHELQFAWGWRHWNGMDDCGVVWKRHSLIQHWIEFIAFVSLISLCLSNCCRCCRFVLLSMRVTHTGTPNSLFFFCFEQKCGLSALNERALTQFYGIKWGIFDIFMALFRVKSKWHKIATNKLYARGIVTSHGGVSLKMHPIDQFYQVLCVRRMRNCHTEFVICSLHWLFMSKRVRISIEINK